MELLIVVMKFLPKNALSYLFGACARWELPTSLQSLINRCFCHLFGIDLSEAAKPLSSYASVEELFTRELKPDSRPLQKAPCSPADGVLSYSLAASPSGQALQVKGLTYQLDQLVFGRKAHAADSFAPAWYSTVYLAPHNYHRVHSPVSGSISSLRYIPGELWPVNIPFMRRQPGILVSNERLVVTINASGGGKAYVVLVGAYNVGRIASRFWPEFVTNPSLLRSCAPKAQPEARHKELKLQQEVAAGDELGVFMLGSTVVCVFDTLFMERHKLWACETAHPIRMGQSLAQV